MKHFRLLFVLVMWAVALSANVFAQDVKEGQKYTIEKGDWLSKISQKFYRVAPNDSAAWLAIAQANGITDLDRIYPGQELIIPPIPTILPPIKISGSGGNDSLAEAAAKRAEAATVVLKDTCQCDSAIADMARQQKKTRNCIDFLVEQYVIGQKRNPRLKFAAYHFQTPAERTGGRRVFNEGAFFTLTAGGWLRASSGTEVGQLARVSVSPLPKIWKNQYFQLRAGLNASLISQDAHFDTQMPNYTPGKIQGCLGVTVLLDSLFSRAKVRVDWLGVGNNVRPGDETIYYSWVGGLRNTNLYPFEFSADLGKGFSAEIEGLAEGKKLNVPYFFATVNRKIYSFPSIFSRATQLYAYAGYGEVKMAGGPSHRSPGVILGIGIGF